MPILSARGGASAGAYGWGALSAGIPAFESIASASGTGSSGVITFSSIPSTFKHLQIRYAARSSAAFAGMAMQIQFNGDTGSNYYWHDFSATDAGVTTSSSAATNIGQIPSNITGSSSIADAYGVCIIDIPNYASSKKKVARAFFSSDQNASSGTNQRSGMESILWNSTSAISSISLTAYSGNYTTQSEFSLYGIKGKA